MNKPIKKYPAWTYKQPIRHIKSKIPKGSFKSIWEYVKAFEKENGLIPTI